MAKRASTAKKTGSKRKAGPRRKRSTRRRALRSWSGYGLAIALLLVAGAIWIALGVASSGRAAVAALALDAPGAPVEVFAAPRVLRPGFALNSKAFERELAALGYLRLDHTPRNPGEYRWQAGSFEIYRRAHSDPAGEIPAGYALGRVDGGRLKSLVGASGQALRAFVCEPLRLGAYRGSVLQERRPLEFEEFPPRMVEAVLAAEDSRFLKHRGIDPRGIVRAAWTDLLRRKMVQGGSTITQQVIKNRIVGSERTLFRKLREASLSLYVERRIGKKRLLTIYLNEIYLGQDGPVSIVGLPAAARHYFGKNMADLGLDEMAQLAGMIASPGRFDPARHPEEALSRRAWVLGRMAKLGNIDAVEAEAAAGRALKLSRDRPVIDPAGDVLDAVHRELTGRGREPQPGVSAGKVFTSIDPRLQRVARKALAETLSALEKERPSRKPLEGAVVVLRPASGEVVALVGGREGTAGRFNRALDARRQPGSAFKPFVALGAISQLGMAPGSMLDDSPLELHSPTGTWKPRNHDGKFRGPISLRSALEDSVNVPIARLGLQLGPAELAKLAGRIGFSSRLPQTPSLALGSGEVSLMELATAYGTLVNLGTRHENRVVRGIEFPGESSEQVLASLAPGERVVDPVDAWLALDALTGVVERGTGRALSRVVGSTRVAAKTGTSQDGRDAWFVLVTGSAVVVAWVGRDDNKPARLWGSRAALPVVARMLEEAGDLLLDPLPTAPSGIVRVRLDPSRGCALSSRATGGVLEVFRAGEEPEPCSSVRSFWRRLWRREKTR